MNNDLAKKILVKKLQATCAQIFCFLSMVIFILCLNLSPQLYTFVINNWTNAISPLAYLVRILGFVIVAVFSQLFFSYVLMKINAYIAIAILFLEIMSILGLVTYYLCQM